MKLRNACSFFAFAVAILSLSQGATAAAVVRVGTGANTAALQTVVGQFRTDLGGVNNGTGGSFVFGRREIDWENVPDSQAEPNPLLYNFFNTTSARGIVLHSIGNIGGNHQFRASASASSGTTVLFGNIDTSYTTTFVTFSGQRIFHARFANVIEIHFFIPGTNIPATVSGFGAIFCDVDTSNTFIEYYEASGNKISGSSLNTLSNGMSFLGTSFNAGERVAKVIIRLGANNLQTGSVDGVGGVDVVAMDDFIYGEPRAMQFHDGDFDGDGFADPAVFRASAGTFFVLNTGSNTFNAIPFGIPGDVPVDGDFDGDKRADVAIYRPSAGEWWINRSSTGVTVAAQFGATSDKPTPRDFDKDGKTDIAFWRPANGTYFVLRSSDNSFFSFPWGQNGDVPVGAAIAP